jgi:fructosamine-3-kinase
VTGRTFVKTQHGAPPDFFIAEARGLDLLRIVGGPPVPAVLSVSSAELVLERIEPGHPTVDTAREFGRALVAVHRSGGNSFGATESGYIATLRQDNTWTDSWPAFYAERRLAPMLREATDRGGITPTDRASVEQLVGCIDEVAGSPEPPSLIHGDLWSGNVVWGRDGRAWLIDAASVHHGHRETDLAMLALFGAPYLAEILAAYDEAHPLADGWRSRVPLHQVFPLLVHAALFGGGYGARASDAARQAMMAQ